jgi:excisionase family DNA binding protein
MTERRQYNPPPPGAEHLTVLTVEETADLLRCSRAHVYVLASREGLPLTRLGGRTVVRTSELDAWLNKNTEHAG